MSVLKFLTTAEEQSDRQAEQLKAAELRKLSQAEAYCGRDGKKMVIAMDKYIRESPRTNIRFTDLPQKCLAHFQLIFRKHGFNATAHSEGSLAVKYVLEGDDKEKNRQSDGQKRVSIFSLIEAGDIAGGEELKGEPRQLALDAIQEDVTKEIKQEESAGVAPLPGDVVPPGAQAPEITNLKKATRKDLAAYLESQGIGVDDSDTRSDLAKLYEEHINNLAAAASADF